jgi:hypothetical protein
MGHWHGRRGGKPWMAVFEDGPNRAFDAANDGWQAG